MGENISSIVDRPALTFSLFIQSMAHQALMCLGVVPMPDSDQVHKNIDQAKEVIDILSLLHVKTKGNLTSEEEKLFEKLLYELRMMFVEIGQAK